MVAVGDVYELVVEWIDNSNTTKMLNVFHFRQKAGVLTAINLIGEWRTYVENTYRMIPSSGAGIRRYSARSLIPFNTDFYETFLSPTIAGGGNANPCPSVVTAIMTWRTGLPGRRRRGRTYVPWISNNVHVNGVLGASFVQFNMGDFGNLMVSRFGPGGSSPTTEFGVWSRLNAGADPPFDPAGFTPVTAFTAQPALGSMGSRRFGRGM